MTRAQKRENSLHYLQKVAGLTRTDMVKEQQEDPKIQHWKKQEDPTRVIERKKILLWQWSPRAELHVVLKQLVLPRGQRLPVLKLAHDMPMAGHLGKKKTVRQILQQFYWPTIYHDVSEHCKRCPEC